MKTKVFWAMNRHNKTVVELKGFDSWEHVQGCFRVGFRMPDGQSANGIGRSASKQDFIRKANHGGFTILPTEL